MDFRFFLGLPAAAAITAALFLLMAAMIRTDAQISPPGEQEAISIVPKLIDSRPDRTKRPPQEKLKDPPPIDRRPAEKSDLPPIDARGADPDRTIKRETLPGLKFRSASIKVAPQYPEQCRARGVQGRVVVQFDVTDEGETTNIRIVSSADSCLVRAVIRAVSGWRYPPQTQRGLVEVFDFRLDQ